MDSVHLLIEGRVQRVGFRRFVLRQAERLHLTGWVRNNDDGTVEAFASGDKSCVIEFINQCRQGPLFSKVLNIQFLSVTQEVELLSLPDRFSVLRDV